MVPNMSLKGVIHCIIAKDYTFLDITEYVGHISYFQFLKSVKMENEKKRFFPYKAAKSFFRFVAQWVYLILTLIYGILI